LGSILALAGNIQGVFDDSPAGSVRVLDIQNHRPLTRREWLIHEGGYGATKGVAEEELRIRGTMLLYRVETAGFKKGTTLPVQFFVQNVSTGKLNIIEGDPIRVDSSVRCGCDDWVPTPRPGDRYYVELQIFPPGPIKGDPEWNVPTEEFIAWR
jgi:hypothetical protein